MQELQKNVKRVQEDGRQPSQVTKSKLCRHCLRGGLKGCTDPVDADERNGKDKIKTPAKSPNNKPPPATKSAVEGVGKEKKKMPAKSLAGKPSPEALSAPNSINRKEKGNHPKPLINDGAAHVPKYRESATPMTIKIPLCIAALSNRDLLSLRVRHPPSN